MTDKKREQLERDPQQFAVCMGMDALRLCIGGKPRNFTAVEVVRWIGILVKPEPSNV